MKRIIYSLALLCGSALFATAGERDASYEQLLKHITPEAMPAAPAPSAAPAPALEQQADPRYWVTAYASNSRERTRLLEAGLDIVEVKADVVNGFAHENTLKYFAANKAVSPIVSAIPMREYMARVAKDFPAADAAYHNYNENTELMKTMVSKNPDIASMFSIGKTVEGRDIWALRINKGAKGVAKSDKPGAFFYGNMHAREHLANEVPLLFAAYLLDNRNDAAIKKYIETLDIYVVPMGNPDGVENDIKSGSYKSYRKNMAKNSDGSVGVDLNRNFDSWWCQEGASNSTWADTYCGPKAFSEPESRAVKAFFEARPNLKTHISFHSVAAEILYPWGGSEADVPSEKDKNVFIKASAEMGKLTGYRPIKSSDMYVATGDSCDWAYDKHGVFAFTIELEGRGFYPGTAVIKTAVEKNIKASLYLLSITDNPYKVL